MSGNATLIGHKREIVIDSALFSVSHDSVPEYSYRSNSKHVEAEFYFALGFAGCELGSSKISDRTRPFI